MHCIRFFLCLIYLFSFWAEFENFILFFLFSFVALNFIQIQGIHWMTFCAFVMNWTEHSDPISGFKALLSYFALFLVLRRFSLFSHCLNSINIFKSNKKCIGYSFKMFIIKLKLFKMLFIRKNVRLRFTPIKNNQ